VDWARTGGPSGRRKSRYEPARAGSSVEYLSQGVRLGWLIDPKSGTALVYRPGRPVEILERPATLSGEDVLPGFVLDLKAILFD
jgi:Uma2 family endonuclease